jgi:hypothetical protein
MKVYSCPAIKRSAINEAREKNKRRFKIVQLIFKKIICVTEYKNNLILLNKISHWFLVTTKLYTRWNIPNVSSLGPML